MPEFRKISHTGLLPAIKEEYEDAKEGEEPFCLTESHAIMRYLCDSRPEEVADHFYPREDLQRRAIVDQYLDWHHNWLREGTTRLVHKKYFSKLVKNKR